jgi:DNA-binding transcriptional regulator LsrR (DeoR family)
MVRDPEFAATRRQELMTHAAWLYYVHDLDQGHVAERLGVSRSRVSRLLAAARNAGIVEIRVHGASADVLRAAAEVERALGLDEVIVEQPLDGEDPRETAARAAASMLDQAVEVPVRIGIGWGMTLGSIAKHVKRRNVTGVDIVEIVGRPNWTGDGMAFEASSSLATAYAVPVAHVPAPALVSSAAIAGQLVRDPAVATALARASSADICLLAVGNVDPRTSPLVSGRVLTAAELTSLARAGAVGDIGLHFFDKDGKPLATAHEERLIGLRPEELKKVPRRIAVAAGLEKVAAIRGAAKGGWITGLITNVETARSLLAPSMPPDGRSSARRGS